MADDHAQIEREFDEAVNMAPAELERFLDSDDSRRVGWKGWLSPLRPPSLTMGQGG